MRAEDNVFKGYTCLSDMVRSIGMTSSHALF